MKINPGFVYDEATHQWMPATDPTPATEPEPKPEPKPEPAEAPTEKD